MVTEYKGFTIIKGDDWKFYVYDGKRFVLSANSLKEAKEFIFGILVINRKVQVPAVK